MTILEIIECKRDGLALTTEQIDWFVEAVTAGTIADYQISALLMAIYLQGMNRQETVALTLAMARSGAQLDLHDVARYVVDKHSSGGVGDKTTLVVLPLVAACAVPVGKMSGRGLGSSGGTLDKMESIRGWSPHLTIFQFKQQIRELGLALAGQTADLAPADGKLYALRDVTGTVASLPLIAASIMSKKLAGGADGVVLDVKVGSGAFMPTVEKATELAELMVKIGVDSGRNVVALICDMNQPLGYAVGNALEVKEAIATLRGAGPADFWQHCLEVAGQMVVLAGRTDTLAEAKALLHQIRNSGRAFATFRQMVMAQGGDVSQIDNPNALPQAPLVEALLSPVEGYLAAIDTGRLGWAAVHLGAGRQKKGDPIDYGVGFLMPVKVGKFVQVGTTLAAIHANTPAQLEQARQEILSAIQWSSRPVPPLPHLYQTIKG